MGARRGRKEPAQRAVDAELRTIEAHSMFLDLVAEGVPEQNAAFEVGWTPRQMHGYLQDKTYAELVIAARDRADGTIEQVVFNKAKEGSPWAVQMYLFNRQPGRWKGNTQRIEVTSTKVGTAEMATAVREGILAVLSSVGPRELQALPPVIEATSWEDTDGEPDGD